MFSNWIEFFKKDIWHYKPSKLSKWKAFILRLLRVFLLTSQGFTTNQIQQGASSLTYYTLLAVVPVLAIFLGIAKGFLLESDFEKWILQSFPEQSEIVSHILRFARHALDKTHEGVLAGVGVGLLLWASIEILSNIETTMNEIWEIKKGRSLSRKFVDYLALIILCPLVIFLTNGLAIFLSSRASQFGMVLFKEVDELLFFFIRLISFFLNGLLLTFLYMFLPNKKVRFFPAFIAGIVTAAIYQIVQWVYFYFQIGVASYGAIYGTFAAIPLFLIWLHLSWILILLGAKLAFAIENVDNYEFKAENILLSPKQQKLTMLLIAHFIIKKFCVPQTPPSILDISNHLEIPISLTQQMTANLVRARVISVVKKENHEDGFQPARSVDMLTIEEVLHLIEDSGDKLSIPMSPPLKVFLKSLEKFDSLIKNSGEDRLLKEI